MNSNHLIQSFKLEVEARDEKSHVQFLASVSEFAQKDLCKILEEVMDSLGLEDRIIQIEKLEIDLGETSWSNRDALKTKFRMALEKELQFPVISQSHRKLEKIPETASVKKRELSKSEERKERWEHYLNYGSLPWWDQNGRAADFNFNTDLRALIEQERSFFISVLDKNRNNKFLFQQVIRRLLQYLGDDLYAALFDGARIPAIQELTKLFSVFKGILSTVSETQFNQEVLWHFFTGDPALRKQITLIAESTQISRERAWQKLLPEILQGNKFPLLKEELDKIWKSNSARLEFLKQEMPRWYERAEAVTGLLGQQWFVRLSDLIPSGASASEQWMELDVDLRDLSPEAVEKLLNFIRENERDVFPESRMAPALTVALSAMDGLPEPESELVDETSYQWLLRYLKTGSLPWVQRQFTREDIEGLIRLMHEEDPIYFNEYFARIDLFRFPQVWERVVKQFSPDIQELFSKALKVEAYLDRKQSKLYREKVLNLFFTQGLIPWKDLLDGNEERILEVLIGFYREDPAFFRRAIRESKIMQNAELKQKIVEVLGERIWKFLFEQSGEKEPKETARKKLQLTDLLSDFNELMVQLEVYFKQGKFLSDVVPTFEEIFQSLSRIQTRDARLILAVYHHRYPDQIEKALGDSWTEELREALSFEKAKTEEEEPEEFELPDFLKPKEKPKEKTEAERLTPEGTVMYIRNSGLVLLHPFISRFFTMLKLTEKRAFVNDDAMERAVHLLQYLVYEKSDMPEFELVLNKILCGMAPAMPVKSEITITDSEKDISESLLQGVIANWAILKNTSIENFRASFLHREGRLSKEPDGWRLRVEQKGYDVLLKHIPWGYSTVKLPWMKEVVYVDWTS